MIEQWNERFAGDEYVYGMLPNEFLKTELLKIKPGTILFPSEGEGRNAVYAAKQGFDVFAFDFCEQAKTKATALAIQNNIIIHYEILDVNDAGVFYKDDSFDCIALIYAHFHNSFRREAHRNLIKKLKPGGVLILEAFTLEQMPHTSGGPKNADLLYTAADMQNDFAELSELHVAKQEIFLNEGKLHQGPASVVRVTGKH